MTARRNLPVASAPEGTPFLGSDRTPADSANAFVFPELAAIIGPSFTRLSDMTLQFICSKTAEAHFLGHWTR
jgi:hypothetical protein